MRPISMALDCDGVLADFCAGALRIIEEVTGKQFDTHAITEHDFTKALGLSPSEADAVEKAISGRRGFAMSLPRFPRARQGVRRLRALGSVFCVTKPWTANIWWRSERDSWLALHFGIDHVHHVDDKSSCEADVFVDDNADHVRKWLATWPGRTAVLWRTPHNRKDMAPQGAQVTESWEDLYQIARETARNPIQGAAPLMSSP